MTEKNSSNNQADDTKDEHNTLATDKYVSTTRNTLAVENWCEEKY